MSDILQLSMIKDIVNEDEDDSFIVLTLYKNGTIYLPINLGNADINIQTSKDYDIELHLSLNPDAEYKKFIYIPIEFARKCCGTNKQIKLYFEQFSKNYYIAELDYS